MKEVENSNETLNKVFSVLTEENRNSVIEMTRFLVLTQNTIVPELLKIEKKYSGYEGVGSLASETTSLTSGIK